MPFGLRRSGRRGARRAAGDGPVRLHVGAGRAPLAGWVNLDVQDLPGIDVVADVTEGLDFDDVEAIFAEHFLEHLPLDQALDFLVECHRALRPGAWLRLSTPNLDWVWMSHYDTRAPDAERELMALRANRAFHGWRHRFLWNRPLLGRALRACGFDEVRWCRWGESEQPLFHGIERHETCGDSEEYPHVLIAEARKGEPRPAELSALRELFADEFLHHLDD